MSTDTSDGVSIATKASVYFEGECSSHAIVFPDGSERSVDMVLRATLNFGTGAAEIMECVAGSCEYRLAGSDVCIRASTGESFQVAAQTRFDIRVTEPYHTICHCI